MIAPTQKLIRFMLAATVSSVLFAGLASATPILFQLDNVTIVGSFVPTVQTYNPALPITGSGDIDFGAGTGTLVLSDYDVFIDVNADGNDAQLEIVGWTQTIISIDGGGNIVSTGGGTSACTNLGGFGGFVCGATSPTVLGWPPVDGTLPSSALINTGAQTITIVDNSNALAGTVTQFYSYTLVTPEPGTALLMGAGLLGLGLVGARRRDAA
jgi:hypothetical protein